MYTVSFDHICLLSPNSSQIYLLPFSLNFVSFPLLLRRPIWVAQIFLDV